MLTVRLPSDMEKRLNALSRATNRSKSYYARKALSEVMGDRKVEIQKIDWNTAWYSAQLKGNFKPRYRGAAFWNRRAPAFAGRQKHKSDYPRQFLNILKPQPHWRVLDVGCGSGTLTIPLSDRVAAVTALDFSENMLALLEREAVRQQITNITTVLASWQDDWEDMGVGQHDVVIASRSLISADLTSAIEKLNRFAKHRVCISAMVGDGPFDRRIIEAAGRVHQPGPDYIYVLNLLHQMGIYADLSFTIHPVRRTYENYEDALQQSLWMIEDITFREQSRLRSFFKNNLVRRNDRWELPGMAPVRWAVISWNPPEREAEHLNEISKFGTWHGTRSAKSDMLGVI